MLLKTKRGIPSILLITRKTVYTSNKLNNLKIKTVYTDNNLKIKIVYTDMVLHKRNIACT